MSDLLADRLAERVPREVLEQFDPNGQIADDNVTFADLIVNTLIAGALKGDPRFLAMVYERNDGKSVQQLQVERNDRREITLKIAVPSGAPQVMPLVEGSLIDVEPRAIESDGA